MGIFQSKKEEKKKNIKKEKSVTEKKMVIKEDKGADRVLLSPWITEKTHNLMDDRQYVFKVFPKATKKNIKQAIKSIYNVTPESVKIINIHRKKKKAGLKTVYRSGFKKAIIKLKPKDKIEIYE